MLELLTDLWAFIRFRKRYWLAPTMLLLVLLGAFVAFIGGSTLSPFIYALF